MAKEAMKLRAYRITTKHDLKVKKKAERKRVSEAQIIRNLIETHL